jgi:hypothetical protein
MNEANTRRKRKPSSTQFQPGNPGRPRRAKSKDSTAYVHALRDEVERRGGKEALLGWLKALNDDQLLSLVKNRIPRQVHEEIHVGPTLEDCILQMAGREGK